MAKERGINGKWYEVLKQQKSESCAAASIRMMGLYMNGSDPGEGTARCFITRAESGDSGTLGGGGVVAENTAAHDFSSTGTMPTAMKTALASLRPAITATYLWEHVTTAPLRTKIAEVSPKNPMIIGVYWQGGGGHVMVGVDRVATSGQIIVADPGYGVRYINADGTYHPATGVTGNVVLAVYKQ